MFSRKSTLITSLLLFLILLSGCSSQDYPAEVVTLTNDAGRKNYLDMQQTVDYIHPSQTIYKTEVISKQEDKKNNKNKTKVKETLQKTHIQSEKTTWIWPIKGKVIGKFANNNKADGIEIQGKLGLIIKASATGQVVFSDKIDEYGNLIIIKHHDNYTSAYAYNSKNLVQEGTEVQQGQAIAEMGGSNNQPILHFEIRNDGKPLDPESLLPKR